MPPGVGALEDRPAPLLARGRPALVWSGLVVFFVGTIALGATLSAQRSGAAVEAFVGPFLLAFGVGLVGAGFAHRPTGGPYDPAVEFEPWQRLVIGLVAIAFLGLALAAVLAV